MLDWLGYVSRFVENVVVPRSVEQAQHMSIRIRHVVVIKRLCIEASVDLFTRGAVEVPNLKTKTCRLNKGVCESSDADVVNLALVGLDVVAAVRLDVAHGHEVSVLICMCL